MTVAWSTVKPAIKTFVANTSGLAAEKVVWSDEANPILQEPYIELSISGEQQVGEDDVETTDTVVEGANYLVSTVKTTVEFTLSIRYRSRSAANAVSARQVLQRIRSSFHHPKRRAVLEAVDVAFLDTLTVVAVPVVHDNRKESVAVLDARMSAISALDVDVDDLVLTVERAEITPTRDDTELPTVEVP